MTVRTSLSSTNAALRRLDNRVLKLDRPVAGQTWLRGARRWWLGLLPSLALLPLAIVVGGALPYLLATQLAFMGFQSGYLRAEHERLNGAPKPFLALRRPRALDPH